MMFQGFGPEALPFFQALAFHQSKEWFDENRGLYETQVKQPFGDLIEELTARFAKAGIPLKGSRKGSMFRLNRDVRFSKSKDLYKTHAGGTLSRTGAKLEPGILYIHVDPKGCFLAAGFFRPEPQVLARLRTAIRRDPAAFRAMLAALGQAGLSLAEAEMLSRLPRGFEGVTEPDLVAAVRRKSFLVRLPVEAALVGTPAFVDAIAAFAGNVLPLLNWGWRALAETRD
jgi:uncharacterized protein (TIGR02453 family)